MLLNMCSNNFTVVVMENSFTIFLLDHKLYQQFMTNYLNTLVKIVKGEEIDLTKFRRKVQDLASMGIIIKQRNNIMLRENPLIILFINYVGNGFLKVEDFIILHKDCLILSIKCKSCNCLDEPCITSCVKVIKDLARTFNIKVRGIKPFEAWQELLNYILSQAKIFGSLILVRGRKRKIVTVFTGFLKDVCTTRLAKLKSVRLKVQNCGYCLQRAWLHYLHHQVQNLSMR